MAVKQYGAVYGYVRIWGCSSGNPGDIRNLPGTIYNSPDLLTGRM